MNWEAIITALTTAGILNAIVFFILNLVLRKITGSNEISAKNSDKISKSVEKISDYATNIVKVAKDTTNLLKETSDADFELNDLYGKANKIVTDKLTLLGDLRKIVDTYLKES